jgi:aminoglycoside/choline kinase family phosphotransferase
MGRLWTRALERFLRWFDLIGLQRHLKAIGVFARLKHRDAKPGYLADISCTLDYVYAVAAGQAGLAPQHCLLQAWALRGVMRRPWARGA